MLRFQIRKRLNSFSSIKDRINQERAERLKNLPTTTQEKIRNFGIIAHIDAGKTTTTERMLFYAGAIPFPGEVHEGTTTMDFMPQERARGITIRSAAISFNWEGHQYNLIDTPGHIDFTAEVERSLRVLDGAVAIFDGVSGVQTQSETVWLQANKFNIPKIAFINKMDRQGASLEYTIDSMKSRLSIKPFIMQIPIGEVEHFNSVIDLLTLKEICWLDKYGSEVEFRDIDKTHRYYDKAIKSREELLQTISEYDDKIAELYLEDSKDLLNQNLVINSIREIVNKNCNLCCPVYVGSSLKNRGVQPLLEAVHQILPGPSERPPIVDINNPENIRKLEKSQRLAAYIYKVINDQTLGQLGFTRVYSGEMAQKQNYMNSTKDELIKVSNIYRVRANRYVSINNVQAGDIVAIQSKQVVAGSTIIGANDEKFVLQQLQLPQCVFFAQLEYESAKDKPKLDQALQQLQLEDDSLKITVTEDSFITIGGQGELHLEIIVQRLKEDFGLNTKLKKLQVEYKETISEEGEVELKYTDILKGRPLWFHLRLKLEPIESLENEIVFDFDRDSEFDILYKEYKETQAKQALNQKVETSIKYIKNPCKLIETELIVDDHGEEKAYHLSSLQFPMFIQLEQNLQASLKRGLLKSYQMHGIRATILDGSYSIKRTTDLAIGRAIQKMMMQLSEQVKPIILEPIMDLEISCPNNLQQKLINDLISQRRGKIIEIEQDQHRAGSQQSNRVILKATIPSQESIGYSTIVRSLTQGEAYFSMSFKNYEYVGGQKQAEIIQEIF